MKKYILSLAVLVMAAAAMAFTTTQKPTVKTTQFYQFTGNSTSSTVLRDLDNWESVPAEVEGCSTGSLPCFVATEMSISDWLNERSDQAIVQDAEAQRN